MFVCLFTVFVMALTYLVVVMTVMMFPVMHNCTFQEDYLSFALEMLVPISNSGLFCTDHSPSIWSSLSWRLIMLNAATSVYLLVCSSVVFNLRFWVVFVLVMDLKMGLGLYSIQALSLLESRCYT